jgi:hypothetical protein
MEKTSLGHLLRHLRDMVQASQEWEARVLFMEYCAEFFVTFVPSVNTAVYREAPPPDIEACWQRMVQEWREQL